MPPAEFQSFLKIYEILGSKELHRCSMRDWAERQRRGTLFPPQLCRRQPPDGTHMIVNQTARLDAADLSDVSDPRLSEDETGRVSYPAAFPCQLAAPYAKGGRRKKSPFHSLYWT